MHNTCVCDIYTRHRAGRERHVLGPISSPPPLSSLLVRSQFKSFVFQFFPHLKLPMRCLQQLLRLLPGTASGQHKLIDHHLLPKCVHFFVLITFPTMTRRESVTGNLGDGWEREKEREREKRQTHRINIFIDIKYLYR